jgi:hypothetical protein
MENLARSHRIGILSAIIAFSCMGLAIISSALPIPSFIAYGFISQTLGLMILSIISLSYYIISTQIERFKEEKS